MRYDQNRWKKLLQFFLFLLAVLLSQLGCIFWNLMKQPSGQGEACSPSLGTAEEHTGLPGASHGSLLLVCTYRCRRRDRKERGRDCFEGHSCTEGHAFLRGS